MTSRHPFQTAFLEVLQLRLEFISGKIQAVLLRDEHSDQSSKLICVFSQLSECRIDKGNFIYYIEKTRWYDRAV